MFKVTTEKTFTREVKIQVPTDNGHTTQSMKVTYRVVPEEELSHEVASHLTQKADCQKIIDNIEDLVGEDGGAVPYTPELRDKLIEYAYVRLPILQAYLTAITKVRAGN